MTKLAIILTLLTMAYALELKYLRTDQLITLKKGNCRLKTGTIKLIHLINIDEIEETVNYLAQLTFKMSNTTIEDLLSNKVRSLHDNLLQIKPSIRFKRWDTVGQVLKWIGGTPDADDLRIINTTMNDLITQNNEQYKINTQLDGRITQLMKSVAQHRITENRELEAVQILMKLNDVNHILENIMDSILNTKIKQPNSKLLSISELQFIQETLNKQGVSTITLEEALQFTVPLMAAQRGKLVYILKVPRLHEQPGE